MENQVWYHVAHPSPDIPAAGHFSQHVQESSKCYHPNVRKGTPGSYALHHLVNNTNHHTSTHILGPHERFGGIPVHRRSSSLENGGVCTPLDFSARGSTNILFHRFKFLGHIHIENQVCTMWHILAPIYPQRDTSPYTSRNLPSVIARM